MTQDSKLQKDADQRLKQLENEVAILRQRLDTLTSALLDTSLPLGKLRARNMVERVVERMAQSDPEWPVRNKEKIDAMMAKASSPLPWWSVLFVIIAAIGLIISLLAFLTWLNGGDLLVGAGSLSVSH